jgi:hypothetical protein
MKTLNLQQAAELLHVHPVTLQEKANLGEVPAAKIGRRWVFIDIDLFEYIRAKYNWRALQGDSLEDSQCHFTNAKVHRTGGSNLPTTAKRYREALGLPIKR